MYRYHKGFYSHGNSRIFFFILLFLPIAKIYAQQTDSIDIENSHQKGLSLFNNLQYYEAIQEWEQTLALRQKYYGENHLETARSYFNIGASYSNLELDSDSKFFLEKALIIRLNFFDNKDEKLINHIIINYKLLGKALKETGDFDQALFIYNSCLEKINQNHKQYPNILKYKAQTLNSKGVEFQNDAIDLLKKSNSIFKSQKQFYEQAKTLNDLGNVYYSQKAYQKALNNYKASFDILKEINDYDITYNNIIKVSSNLGDAYTMTSQYEQAEQTLLSSIKIAKEVYGETPIFPDYTLPYSLLGDLYKKTQDYEKAIRNYDIALNNTILNFSDIAAHPSDINLNELEFIGQKSDAIEILFQRAQCLEKQGKTKETFENLKFIDQIILSLRHDIETESSNLIWAQDTREIYAYAAQLAIKEKLHEDAFDFIEKSKAVILFENLLKAKSERIANLPDSTRTKLSGIKQEITYLKEELMYSILEENKEASNQFRDQIFLKRNELKNLEHAISLSAPEVFSLQTNPFQLNDFQKYLSQQNTTAINFFRYNNYITALVIDKNNITPFTFNIDTTFQNEILDYIQIISSPKNTKESLEKSKKLSIKIYSNLIQPLNISNNQQLLIIPDGILQFIPFEALITKNNQYLLKENPVHYAYSASVQLQLNEITNKASKHALIISPKKYDDLPDLNSSEAPLIRDILNGYLLEMDSANSGIFQREAPSYQLLHLSTHAAVPKEELAQPWIALNDRKVKLPELYNMNLNAQLVTLSACETANGALVEGEGVMSLARGFSYAGVPQVITSLWEVNENSTAQIMEYFYHELSKGEKPSKALHLAKLTYLENNSLSKANPYHWAAFTAWGHDSYSTKPSKKYWIFGLLGIVILGCIFFLSKRGIKKQ